jgi:hypothetical protein
VGGQQTGGSVKTWTGSDPSRHKHVDLVTAIDGARHYQGAGPGNACQKPSKSTAACSAPINTVTMYISRLLYQGVESPVCQDGVANTQAQVELLRALPCSLADTAQLALLLLAQ